MEVGTRLIRFFVFTEKLNLFNFALKFPKPALGTSSVPSTLEIKDKDEDNSSRSKQNDTNTKVNVNRDGPLTPGALPEAAGKISNAARSLLKRLLESDPKMRMKSLRQLQQTAFYMGFNFEHVKAKKVSPKSILELHGGPSSPEIPNTEEFMSFDEVKFSL